MITLLVLIKTIPVGEESNRRAREARRANDPELTGKMGGYANSQAVWQVQSARKRVSVSAFRPFT
jgi:hypothetical protein